MAFPMLMYHQARQGRWWCWDPCSSAGRLCGFGISISASQSLVPQREHSLFTNAYQDPPDQLLGHHGVVQGEFPELPRLISCQTTRATPTFLCCCIINLAKLGHSRVKGATVKHSTRPTSINGAVWLTRWPSGTVGPGSRSQPYLSEASWGH